MRNLSQTIPTNFCHYDSISYGSLVQQKDRPMLKIQVKDASQNQETNKPNDSQIFPFKLNTTNKTFRQSISQNLRKNQKLRSYTQSQETRINQSQQSQQATFFESSENLPTLKDNKLKTYFNSQKQNQISEFNQKIASLTGNDNIAKSKNLNHLNFQKVSKTKQKFLQNNLINTAFQTTQRFNERIHNTDFSPKNKSRAESFFINIDNYHNTIDLNENNKVKQQQKQQQEQQQQQQQHLHIQHSDQDKSKIDYINFSKNGFSDYLQELKRSNKKNNKLNSEISYLLQSFKDPAYYQSTQNTVNNNNISSTNINNNNQHSIKHSIKNLLKNSLQQQKSITKINQSQQQDNKQLSESQTQEIKQKDLQSLQIKNFDSDQNQLTQPENLKKSKITKFLNNKIQASNNNQNLNSISQLIKTKLNQLNSQNHRIPSKNQFDDAINNILTGIKEIEKFLVRKKLVLMVIKDLGGNRGKLNEVMMNKKNNIKEGLSHADFENEILVELISDKLQLELWQDMQYFLSNMLEFLNKRNLHYLKRIEESINDEKNTISEIKEKFDKKWNVNSLPGISKTLYQDYEKELLLNNKTNQNLYLVKAEMGVMGEIARLEKKYGYFEGISQQTRNKSQYLNEAMQRMNNLQ